MPGPKKRVNIDGLMASERRIMELWDAGKSIEAIAEELEYGRNFVSTTVSQFDEGAEARLHIRNMREGSAALLAALRRAAHA